jgi:hypothetical protein
MSTEAFEELQQLQSMLNATHYHPEDSDSWMLIWGSQKYSSRKYYQLVFQHLQVHQIFKAAWKSKCIPRIKFFLWLLLVDRLNTRTMLLRRNFHVTSNDFCVLCDHNIPEDIDHLFFSCPFAIACWQKLGFQWNMSLPICDRIWEVAGRGSAQPFTLEFIIMAAWEIWNIKNSVIFDNGVATPQVWLRKLSPRVTSIS